MEVPKFKQIFFPGRLVHINQFFNEYKNNIEDKGFRFKAQVLFFLAIENVENAFSKIGEINGDSYLDGIVASRNMLTPVDLELSNSNFYVVVQEKDSKLILKYQIPFEVEIGKSYFFIGEFLKDKKFPLFLPRITTEPVQLNDHVYENTVYLMQNQIYKICFDFSSAFDTDHIKRFNFTETHRVFSHHKKIPLFQAIKYREKMKRFNLFRFAEKPPKDKRIDSKTDIGEGPIFAKGWLKWLSYNPSQVPDIRNFYVNEAYDEQFSRLNHTNGTESDDFGPIDIPDKLHFFFVLTSEAIYVFTARRNDITKIQRSMTFSSIMPQVKGYWMGGVEDLGEFAEGYCFRIKSSSKASDEVWAICADKLSVKEEWMVKIAVVSLRLKPSKPLPEDSGTKEGEYDLGNLAVGETQKLYPEIGPDGQPMELYLKKPTNDGPVDGKWVTLQEWSTCTLACGGGTSTFHRQCIPPQNGGAQCEGSAILTKECNTDPCETVVVEKGEELPLKMKLQKISARWQRYETCVIKEADVEVVRTDMIQLKKKPRTPARAILNNQTFSVYQGEEFESLIFSCPIEYIKNVVEYPPDTQGCFIVPDSRTWTKITLCAVSTDLNYTQSKLDWMKAISFFRDNCRRPFTQYKDPAKAELEMLLQMKKNALKKEEVEDVSMSGGGNQELDIKGFTSSLQKLQKMAVQALSKEMKYEQLMFSEEKMREAEEKKKIAKLKEELKEKEDCIRRDTKKRALKSETKQQKQTLNLNLEDLENTIKGIVLKKRSDAMKQVEIMKKMFEIKKKKDASEMQEVRVKMAGEMMSEEKKGNKVECNPKAAMDEIKAYCNKAYGDNFNLNLDCRNPENFCYFCCENEFGSIMADEKQSCMDECGKTDEAKPAGGWLFLPPSSKVKKEDPDKEEKF